MPDESNATQHELAPEPITHDSTPSHPSNTSATATAVPPDSVSITQADSINTTPAEVYVEAQNQSQPIESIATPIESTISVTPVQNDESNARASVADGKVKPEENSVEASTGNNNATSGTLMSNPVEARPAPTLAVTAESTSIKAAEPPVTPATSNDVVSTAVTPTLAAPVAAPSPSISPAPTRKFQSSLAVNKKFLEKAADKLKPTEPKFTPSKLKNQTDLHFNLGIPFSFMCLE